MEKQFKLPKEFAIKWLEALRSGKYLQGQRSLVDDNHYCCIGVAGSICGIEDSDMAGIGLFSKLNEFDNTDLLDEVNFPVELRGAADNCISEFNPLVKELMSYNDGVYNHQKKSFIEIADWIEENVEFY